MKVCHTEAMKILKELDQRKQQAICTEDMYCKVSYREGEAKTESDYDYFATREEIAEVDKRAMKIRAELTKANCTVKVNDELTICEALIYLAQLQSRRMQLEDLAANCQLSRRITPNGTLEYTECTYDVKQAKLDLQQVRNEINSLQMAIDRANLNNYIEV